MLGVAGCGPEENETTHEHTFSEEWTFDEEYHWHEAICGHDEVSGRAAHTFYGSACTVCGYEKQPEATEGLGYEASPDGTYCIVTGIGTTTDTNIVIPSEYNGMPVKEIRKRAFEGCDSLESITIPNSVASIGDSAFEYCTSLTSVSIGDGVASIGDSAFKYCHSLANVSIGVSVASVGAQAFAWSTLLQT